MPTKLLLLIFRFIFLFILPACLLATESKAQVQVVTDTTLKDSIQTPVFADTMPAPAVADTTALTDTVKRPFEPNPKKAGLYSAILPGLGQVYDRKYWKVPLIYAGLGVAAYFIKSNSDNYRLYRQAYVSRRDADPRNDELTELYSNPDDLKQLQDEYKKYLDLTILITGVGYIAQVVDAIVFAHLKNFDVSRNISMQMKPVVHPYYAGVGLVVNFK